jgi:hypothetical protein
VIAINGLTLLSKGCGVARLNVRGVDAIERCGNKKVEDTPPKGMPSTFNSFGKALLRLAENAVHFGATCWANTLCHATT